MTTQSNPMIDAGLAPGCVFGADPAMQPINAMVGDIARTNIPVLLLGESGTGKEVYARLLHKMSACPEGSFKKIPCAAVDGNRFKNEIADAMRGDGNGDAPATVFLDEIDELDQNCQRTLLSALVHAENSDEDSENTPRLICAASRDLEKRLREADSGESSSSGSMAYACDCRHCGSAKKTSRRCSIISGETRRAAA